MPLATKMKAPLIYISHASHSTRVTLEASLEKLFYRNVVTLENCAQLRDLCWEKRPDLIISGVNFPDGDGIDLLVELSETEPTASIIVTDRSHLSEVEHAMDDHVMAYLIEPVTPDDLKSSIFVVLRRFQEFEALKEENDDLKSALETRKKMERAKGMLMAVHGISEEEAYLKLRKQATDRRMKLSEVAEIVISTISQK